MFLRQALLGCLSRRRRRIRFPDQTSIATILRRTTTPTTTTTTTNASSSSSYTRLFSYQCDDSGYSTWKKNHHRDAWLWILLSGQAAVILGINGNLAFAEDASDKFGTGTGEISSTGLRRIEDGSVVSNSHTSKWRIFTDKGREYFLQGKHMEAEKFFSSALQEAKEGFGERDPHVASACNNLAELYRVRKAFDKAEPLYLEAVNILEESFGPEDIRLGAALHNLGQFYLVQRKLENARVSYERALKIKERVLGHFHTDYADTMFHLGTVMYLLGKEKDAIALVKDSIRILEEAGQGESNTCLRRLRYLAQIYLKSNQITEAENVQRKILHIMEVSKGSNSLDTVVAAEELALTLQANCSLKEAQELLEWCLGVRKTMLPEDHIQIGANMLHMARVAMLSSNRLSKVDNSEAKAELDKAKDLLHNSIRIAERVLDSPKQNQSNMQTNAKLKESGKDDHAALVILLQSLDTLGLLEITKQELDEPKKGDPPPIEAEHAFRQCIAAFKESKTTKSLSDSPEVKAAYLSCLKHLLSLMSETTIDRTQHSRRNTLQELKDEIKHVEAQLSQNRKLKN